MNGTQIKERLHRGERVYGTHILSLMNPVAAAMTTEMELDFAFICTEHMPLDRTEVSMMCQLYAAKGISPIVRVPWPDAAAVGSALDAGAEGIVVPYLESIEDARAMAGAVKYRPLKGQFLKNALTNKNTLPVKTQEFLREFNNDRYLIIGIESVPAINQLEELIEASQADGVFLGPHDITTSMGIPTEYHHPDFVDTIEDVIRRSRRCNVGVGLHYQLLSLPEAILQRYLDAGMNWIINGSDIVVMRNAMNQQLHQLRQMTARQNGHGHGELLQSEPTLQNGIKPIVSCIT
jgi:2-keto-3-deoxy-L-rhamnonate aldolase RhmA